MLFSYKYVSESSKKLLFLIYWGILPLFLRLDLYYNSINNKERIRDMKKKNTLIKFACGTILVVSALGTAQPLFNVLAPTIVFADDVKSGEVKNQVLNFKANSTTSTSQTEVAEPLDIVLIHDASGSTGGDKRASYLADSIVLLRSAPKGSKAMIATYGTNSESSYGGGTYTPLMPVEELANKLEEILKESGYVQQNGQWTRGGGSVFNGFGDNWLIENKDKFGGNVGKDIKEFENAYIDQQGKNKYVSVLQFTDEWLSGEKIDTSFATWAKDNAKTFMSALYLDRITTTPSNYLKFKETQSIRSMVDSGHPNIYITSSLSNQGFKPEDLNNSKRQKDLVETFKSKAIKTTTKTTHQKGSVTITPESDIAISSAELVSPSGKKTPLIVQDGKVSWNGELIEDGAYKVNYTFSGKPKVVRKIVGSVSVDGKLVDSKTDAIIPEVVKATKTEKIPFETEYKDDAEIETGKEKEIQAGIEGVRTIKTEDGKEVSNEITTKPRNRIILRGTKGSESEVKKEKIPFETKYQDDPELETGQEKVITDGVEGEKTITSTYVTQKGKRVGEPTVKEEITKDKVDKVISRGTKGSDSEVKKEKIPFETKYQDDPNLPKGQEKVITDGVEGEKTITSTYVTQKGKRVGEPTIKEEVTKEKVDKVIARGTQEPKTVSYRVVDATDKSKELVKLTKVMEGYTGDKYKVDKPKLEGYTVESSEDAKLEGEIADKDIVIEFIAKPIKNIGKDVVLKFIDTDDRKIAEDKVIAHEKEIGTEFKDQAPDKLKVGDKVYKFIGYKENIETVMGKVTDKEQVFTAVYSAPKELPKTNETNSTRNSIIASVMSVLGIVSFGAWYKLRKTEK